ncbi:cytochrome P450 [Cyathus striatus]|nr:cytochrome P450 [Cyathus striatus]
MSCVYHDAALPIILGAALALAFTTLRSKPFSTHLQGPTSPSWLYGNFQQIFLAIPYGNYEFEWQKLYGMVYRVRGCFGSEHLMVSDGLALRYIINNTSIFTKPPQVQWVNRLGLGSESLLTAVGEQHRRLRVVMNPIFSAVELKKVVPTIQKAAWDASQRLATICNENENRSIDILPLLHNITLQAVGESIMGYNFASNEMFAKCYETLVVSVSRRGKAGLLADAIIPRLPRWVTSLLAYFPPQDLAKLIEHRELSNKIAQSVLESKMEDIKLGLDPEGDLIGRLGMCILLHSTCRLRYYIQFTPTLGTR